MVLLPKEIEEKLPPLYSTENIATKDKIVKIKFFTPPDFRIKSTTCPCFMGFFEKNRHYNLGY